MDGGVHGEDRAEDDQPSHEHDAGIQLGSPAIVAIFVEPAPATLLASLRDPAAIDALTLSLWTSAVAVGIIVLVGTPAAYLLATRRFRGRSVVITLIELALVLPPAVAGIGLLAALGRSGLLGPTLDDAGLRVVLTTASVRRGLDPNDLPEPRVVTPRDEAGPRYVPRSDPRRSPDGVSPRTDPIRLWDSPLTEAPGLPGLRRVLSRLGTWSGTAALAMVVVSGVA